MELRRCGLHYYKRYRKCSCWTTTGTVSVQTTVDAIDEVDETFSIANGTLSTTGTILDDDVYTLMQSECLFRN
jgi:hypothetical protein